MSDKVKGLMLVVFTIFLIALIGSWLTILSINIVFDLNIPVTFETIIAVTWLTMTLKGIFSTNTLNTGK
ncbi:hypothetical protein EB118_17400 [bacterium]|nr:hypothetical protein [bacterium]